MMFRLSRRFLFGATAAVMLAASPLAGAAFIQIDDSNNNTITILAGDFESGFYVNGNLLTEGLGNSGSLTLADGAFSISGSWVDLGQDNPANVVHLYFALPGDPTAVTSGLEMTATTDGYYGTVTGNFYGFTGVPYFSTNEPTFSQNGGQQPFVLPYLDGFFIPKAVPEPASIMLIACAAPVAFVIRRRRRDAA